MSFWPTTQENKPFAVLLMIALVVGIGLMGASALRNLEEASTVGVADISERTITVSGYGRVLGVPDIATVSLGVETRGADVSGAQDKNTTTVNSLLEKIKGLGIEEKDIQTASYNVYEDKPWNPETNDYVSKGWIVSQQIEVKVRDTGKISMVLDAAGKSGVTNIYGPNFTIDDSSVLQAEARDLAVKNAQSKKEALALSLGVKLTDLVDYQEASSSDPYFPKYDAFGGMGAGAPTIAAGQNEVVVNVSMTYRISQ